MASRADKVPDWLLERLAAGELPEEQALGLRARLDAQGEDERLAALVTSNAEILAALPVARVVPEIERRAAAASAAGQNYGHVLGDEAPGRQGATRAHSRSYVTEEQRSRPGWIGSQNMAGILTGGTRPDGDAPM